MPTAYQIIEKFVRNQSSADTAHTVSFQCSDSAVSTVVKLLLSFSALGKIGGSTKIDVHGSDSSYYWDGDGNDKLDGIQVDGEPVIEKVELPADDGEDGEDEHPEPQRSKPTGDQK